MLEEDVAVLLMRNELPRAGTLPPFHRWAPACDRESPWA